MKKNPRQLYILIGVVLAVAALVVIGLKWTFYYDLNDDMFMQRILAGTFTGTPEDHNIQNLYPFSVLVSALYRITAGFDWYALILLALAAVCYVLTIVRTLQRTEEHQVYQIMGVIIETLLYGAVLLYHLVYVQYTVIVGIMGGTAAFLILTSDDADDVKAFLKANIAPFVLIFLGYAIRSEMMMFMIPFCALAVLFRILPLRDVKEILLRIAASLLVLGIGVGVIYGIDQAAYSSPSWSEFRDLFDARTQLYDFASAPAYEGNEEFYESIGLTESEARLFSNYNFGLDDKIDSKVMQQVADYASAQRLVTKSARERVTTAFWVYRYQKILGTSEMPWNMVAFVLYGLVLISALFEIVSAVMDRKAVKSDRDATLHGADNVSTLQETTRTRVLTALWEIVEAGLIFVVRSGLWMYLLYSDRPVNRLTHSMYFAEAMLLMVVLFYHRRLDITAPLRGAFILCTLMYALGAQVSLVNAQALLRENNNEAYAEFLDYAAENSDSFYVVDVYSTVDFSSKMFDNSKVAENWDLAGGWASKSPLESKLLGRYGIDNLQDGLTSDQNVYFVARSEYDTQWIADYYEDKGISVVVNRVDTIGDYWAVYSIDTWEL